VFPFVRRGTIADVALASVLLEMRIRPRRAGALTHLLESHLEMRTEIGAAGSEPAPHIRLQDWRLVDEASVDGTDYVLLRRVQVPRDGVNSLTARERDAIRHACTGASNKEIAYSMKISPSTVGVLLWRAARKLGAHDREELLRIFRSRQS
jgi:DNA-binding CsgD family transcriptional regulator